MFFSSWGDPHLSDFVVYLEHPERTNPMILFFWNVQLNMMVATKFEHVSQKAEVKSLKFGFLRRNSGL